MKPFETLKKVMSEKKITQSKLAELAGFSSQGSISSIATKKISCDMLVKLLDCLDYEVVVQPKTQGKRKDGAMVLEPSGLPDGRGKKRKKEGEENA